MKYINDIIFKLIYIKESYCMWKLDVLLSVYMIPTFELTLLCNYYYLESLLSLILWIFSINQFWYNYYEILYYTLIYIIYIYIYIYAYMHIA